MPRTMPSLSSPIAKLRRRVDLATALSVAARERAEHCSAIPLTGEPIADARIRSNAQATWIAYEIRKAEAQEAVERLHAAFGRSSLDA